jgi:hypothetical protein
MTYCKTSDKPTIKYTFQGQNEKIYKSEFSPVTISTKTVPIDATDNYSKEGFLIRYRSPSCTNFNCAAVVHDYFLRFDPVSGIPQIYIMGCGQTSYQRLSNGNLQATHTLNVGQQAPGQWVVEDRTVKCPSPNAERCSIEISHNGLVIFSDQGNCPVNFSVNCSNCPPGTEEHKSPIYPGYCCLDCASIASEIRGITNTVRGFNRG